MQGSDYYFNNSVYQPRAWSPPRGTKVIGQIYICHGFTEHMENYNGVAEHLSSKAALK